MRRPYRERVSERDLFRPHPPGGALMPRSAARVLPGAAVWILEQQARHHRRLDAVRAVISVSAALALLTLLFAQAHSAMALQAPPVPSDEQICGSAILDGPSSSPGGAVTVPAGDNSALFPFQLPANTTYWFAAGTHTLGSSVFSQIQANTGDVFEGAPGAVIDGQSLNHTAFSTPAGTGSVTVEYLTIQDFAPQGTQGVVNINGTAGWVIKYDTIQDNIPGTGVGLGTDNTLSYDCIRRNGEYAFNAYTLDSVSARTGGPSGITMTFNELSYNDECNYENMPNFPIPLPAGCAAPSAAPNSCGCSGGGKFWAVDQALVADNYVHDNYNVGLWADT